MRTCFIVSLLLFVMAVGCTAGPGAAEDAGAEDAGVDALARDAFVERDAFAADAATEDAFVRGDAASLDADAADVGVDAATCPVTLLVGGTDVTAQGWTTQMIAPATVTYGADYVRLETSGSGSPAGSCCSCARAR